MNTYTVHVFRGRKSALCISKMDIHTVGYKFYVVRAANSNVFPCQIPLCCSPNVQIWPLSASGGEDTIRLLMKLDNIYMDRQSQLTVTHHVEQAWINEILRISNNIQIKFPVKSQ